MWSEVLFSVVFLPHNQDARVVSADSQNQIVQKLIVGMVPGKANPVIQDGMPEMGRIFRTAHANLGRQAHVVPGAPQQAGQPRPGEVVVKVQSHDPKIRA
jgi:hypothetical protein